MPADLLCWFTKEQMNSSNGNTPKKVPTILVNQSEKDPSKGAFVSFPRFWADDYFSSDVEWLLPDGSTRKGTRVAASFWKYTLHLWRFVTIPQLDFSTDIAMDQFPVRPEAAVMWTAAYAFSGVMKVKIGKYSSRHDISTAFTYDPATTHAAWRCFLSALDYAYACREEGHKAAHREKKLPIAANLGAWKVIIAREVDNYRKSAGLKPVNEKFLREAVEGRILDNAGRRIAERDKDGIAQPIFYVKARLQKRDESDEEYSKRIDFETIVEMNEGER